MILNDKEVLSCLIFVCEHMFEDKLRIIETDLSIDEKVNIRGKIIYDSQPFDISVSFLLEYKNEKISVNDIDAKVEYLMFKLNFMNLVKHVLKDYPVTITKDSIIYPIKLPISQIKLINQCIEVKIK